MQHMPFDILVKKLWKKSGSIFSLSDLGELVDPDFSRRPPNSHGALHTLAYRLRQAGVLVSMRNGLFFIPEAHTPLPSELDILDSHYWSIVRKLVRERADGEAFLCGRTAVSILLKDTAAPAALRLHTRTANSRSAIAEEYTIIFRPIAGGVRVKHKNLYAALKPHTSVQEVDGAGIRIPTPELALLDALLNRGSDQMLTPDMLAKFLRRFGGTLSWDTIAALARLRYGMSLVRLRQFAQSR